MSSFSKIRTILPAVAVFLAAAGSLNGAWPAKPNTVKVYVKKRLIATLDNSSHVPVAIPKNILGDLQAEVIEDQETFLLFQLPTPNASASPIVLRDFADLVEIREDFDFLQFASFPIDAREAPPPFPVEWQRIARLPPPARDAFIIQFGAPPRPSWIADLRSTGVNVIDYIPQNGYVVLASGDVLDDAVSRLPIQLARLHQPFHKASQAARASADPFADLEIAIAAVPEAAEAEALLLQNSVATIRPPEFIGDRTYHRATLATAILPLLASLPAVLWIDTYRSPLPSGQREAHLSLGSTLAADPGFVLQPVPGNHRDWINAKGLGGFRAALKVAILDTGFDTAVADGVPSDVHPDFKDAAGNSFVEVRRYTNLSGSNADCSGHGTMVAGVLSGNAGGSSFNTQTRDNGVDSNYLMGLGVLPAMPLIVGRVFNVLPSTGVGCQDPPPTGSAPCFDPQERALIYGDLYNRGVRIVSNSWNRENTPTYTSEAQIHDRIVRAADGTDAGPPTPMTVYFSGGNAEGSPPQFTLVSSPATAKNVISVGGSENFNRSNYTEPPFNPPATGFLDADNGNHHFRVSQIGPTSGDNRIKPDVVAPASGIESPLTRTSNSSCRLGLTGQVIDSQVEPAGRRHLWSRGTSFAAPLAAGAGALLYTWFQNTTGTAPLPSLLKAMQISFARDLTGPGLGRPPDAKQGWGKVDLTRAFDPAGGYVWKNEEQTITATGGMIHLPAADNRYRIKDTSKAVKITLVWTDAAGAPGNALMPSNDLDLTVKFHGANGSGKQALGNDFDSAIGRSNIRMIPDGISDIKNNVEQVVFTFADTLGADQFKVEVFGRSIAADGINVWTGTALQQNFSLFIENAVVNQNNATVQVQPSPPSPVLAGNTFTTTVTMRNTGDTTWSESNWYRLASLAPANPFGSRVVLNAGEQIAPFSSKAFSIYSRAPFAGGTYPFQWQMIEERSPTGPYGGPQFSAEMARQFLIWGQCGIPNTATSISINMTAVDPGGVGYVTAFPPNIVRPLASTMSFRTGVTRANNGITTVDTQGVIEIFVAGAATHLILDINGYFQ